MIMRKGTEKPGRIGPGGYAIPRGGWKNRKAILLVALLLISIPLMVGCGSEPTSEYRERVTAILSNLGGDGHESGHVGGVPADLSNPAGHDHEPGMETGSSEAVELESVKKTLAELEEVRVPAGWEEFHRSLLRALTSLVPVSHQEGPGEHDEEVPGHGEDGEGKDAAPGSEAERNLTGTGEPVEHGHQQPTGH